MKQYCKTPGCGGEVDETEYMQYGVIYCPKCLEKYELKKKGGNGKEIKKGGEKS